MTTKAKAPPASAAPAEAHESEVRDAERIDMNDPTLSDAQAVARNLGLPDPDAAAADE